MQPSWTSVPSQTNRGGWGVVFPRIQGSHQITLHNLSGLQRSWQCSWIHTTIVFCILFDDFQYLHILWHDLLEVQGWCCNHHLHDVASAWKIQRPPVQSAGNTKTLNVEIHVYSETQPISAQSIWQAGEVFLPRSKVFLPISSWMSDYLDKTVQLSGTIRNVRYAVCTPRSCQCSCCTPRNSITF